MNRFDELTALVAVVEHGSFSAAAERLDIAKSAISRRVTDLEARLGVRLLNRTTRRLNLTEPGLVLHERAVQLLADGDEAERMVSAEGTRLSGPLKISTPLSFGLRYLGTVVAEIARTHPDVQLEVDLSDREVDLARERGSGLTLHIAQPEGKVLGNDGARCLWPALPGSEPVSDIRFGIRCLFQDFQLFPGGHGHGA